MTSPRRASLEHISEHGAGVQIVQQFRREAPGLFPSFSYHIHSTAMEGLSRAGMVDLMLSAPNGSGTVSSGATARSGQTQHSRICLG